MWVAGGGAIVGCSCQVGKVARTFSYFCEAPQQARKIKFPFKLQAPEEFSQDLVTLGDRLRRRHLELGMYQKELAKPIPCPDGLMERLAWYKRMKGLRLEQLGALMDRDPESPSKGG